MAATHPSLWDLILETQGFRSLDVRPVRGGSCEPLPAGKGKVHYRVSSPLVSLMGDNHHAGKQVVSLESLRKTCPGGSGTLVLNGKSTPCSWSERNKKVATPAKPRPPSRLSSVRVDELPNNFVGFAHVKPQQVPQAPSPPPTIRSLDAEFDTEARVEVLEKENQDLKLRVESLENELEAHRGFLMKIQAQMGDMQMSYNDKTIAVQNAKVHLLAAEAKVGSVERNAIRLVRGMRAAKHDLACSTEKLGLAVPQHDCPEGPHTG
eukprot:TRINITY_DN65930_c10_g1_i1.p1 TRINITY_DN65930_c10_g1~~TRINITY_DN65930_c10_g1_i1.p1  ORF type:complete len:264 (-),score=3.20 TRINITY_DN65930_c10_g1_i1:487-1278(-)